jgi:hypothetical protein
MHCYFTASGSTAYRTGCHFEMESSGNASENDYEPRVLIEKSEMLKQHLDGNS